MANTIKGLLPSGKAPSVLKNEIEAMIKAQSPDLSFYATKEDLAETSGVKHVSGLVTLTQADGPLVQVYAASAANVNGELLKAGDIAIFRIMGDLAEVRVLDTDYTWRPVGTAPAPAPSPDPSPSPSPAPVAPAVAGKLPSQLSGLLSDFDASNTTSLVLQGSSVASWKPSGGSSSAAIGGMGGDVPGVYDAEGLGGYPAVKFTDPTHKMSYENPNLRAAYTQYFVGDFHQKDKATARFFVNGLNNLALDGVNTGSSLSLGTRVAIIHTWDSVAGSKVLLSSGSGEIKVVPETATSRFVLLTHSLRFGSTVAQYGIYNRTLTDDEMKSLLAGLKAKWKL